jgi:hypothetical protein
MLLAGAVVLGLVTAPLVAWPQQPEGKVYRIGFFGSVPFLKALEEGFRERGYIPGKNIIIEHRSDTGKDATGRGAFVAELSWGSVARVHPGSLSSPHVHFEHSPLWQTFTGGAEVSRFR